MQDNFKDAVAGAKGLLWYGLPGATDLWQPVDTGYAATLKALIAVEHRKWLDTDNHSDRWFSNEEPYTTKKRRNFDYALGGGSVESFALSQV